MLVYLLSLPKSYGKQGGKVDAREALGTKEVPASFLVYLLGHGQKYMFFFIMEKYLKTCKLVFTFRHSIVKKILNMTFKLVMT